MKSRMLIAAALASAAVFAPAAQANLITNGSFENYTLPGGGSLASGSWTILYGTNLTGWQAGTPDYGIEIRNNSFGTASDGDIFVELDTTRNSMAFQNISTYAGWTYFLQFDYSPRTGVGAASNPIQVLWNGNSLGTLTGTNNTSNNTWVTYSGYVTGTSPTSELKFIATGTSDSLGGSLDNVRLDIADVPEPGSLALLGLGLAGLGFARRRKQAA